MASRGDLCLGITLHADGVALVLIDYLERKVISWAHQALPSDSFAAEGFPNAGVLGPFLNNILSEYPQARSVHVTIAEGIIGHNVMDLHGLNNAEIHEILVNKVGEQDSSSASPETALPQIVYFQPPPGGSGDLFQKIPVYYLNVPEATFQAWQSTLEYTALRIGGLSSVDQIGCMAFLIDADASPDVYQMGLYVGEKYSEFSIFCGHRLIELHRVQQTEAALRQWDDEQAEVLKRLKSLFLALQAKYAGGVSIGQVSVFAWNGHFKPLAERMAEVCKASQVNSLEPLHLFTSIPEGPVPHPQVWMAALAALVEGARLNKELSHPTIFDSLLRRKYFFNPQSVGILAAAVLAIIALNVASFSFFKWHILEWEGRYRRLIALSQEMEVNYADIETKLKLYQEVETKVPDLDVIIAMLQSVMPEDSWLTQIKYIPPDTLELHGRCILESSVNMLVDQVNHYLSRVEIRSVENIITETSYQTKFVLQATL